MKCLLVFVALVALSAAQLGIEEAPSAVVEDSAAAISGNTLDETATADESSEGDDDSVSDENTDEPSEESSPDLTPSSTPVTTAQPAPSSVAPIEVVVTSSSEPLPSNIEGRSFGAVAPTLIIPRQPSFLFAPSTTPTLPPPSALPTFAPSFAPLLVKQPTLADILSRPPPSAPRPNIPYRSNVEDKNANLLYYDNEINPDGSYNYRYAIDNGIQAEAEGNIVPSTNDRDSLVLAVRGSFGWTNLDGTPVLITYTADENGYRPVGDAVPTIPPLIARALAWTERRLAERTL